MTVFQLSALIGIIVATICFLDAYRWNKQPQTLYRFFLLNGKLKIGGFVSTILAANLSLGNFLIFIATWGYFFGVSGLIWFTVNLVLNVIGFRLFFRHFKSYIEDHNNSGTIHDFLSQAYSASGVKKATAIRLTASLVTVIGLLLAIVFELSIAVSLMATVTQFQQITVFISLTIIICLFTAFGGFRTLVVSDVCQASILLLATFALFAIMIFSNTTGVSSMLSGFKYSEIMSIGWPNIVSICVIGSGWLLVAMDQWQRTCASRSYDTSKKGVMIYLVIIIFFGLVYGLWGMYDKNVLLPSLSQSLHALHSSGSNPLADIQFLVSTGSHKFVVAFIICGLIGAGLSTTNTFLTVSSHSLTTDVLLFSLAGKTMQDLDTQQNKAFVGIARTVIVAIGILIILVFVGLVTSGPTP